MIKSKRNLVEWCNFCCLCQNIISNSEKDFLLSVYNLTTAIQFNIWLATYQSKVTNTNVTISISHCYKKLRQRNLSTLLLKLSNHCQHLLSWVYISSVMCTFFEVIIFFNQIIKRKANHSEDCIFAFKYWKMLKLYLHRESASLSLEFSFFVLRNKSINNEDDCFNYRTRARITFLFR